MTDKGDVQKILYESSPSGKSLIAYLYAKLRRTQIEERNDILQLCDSARRAGHNGNLEIVPESTFFGIPLHVVADSITKVTRPARVHKSGIGRRGNYHNRIRKKKWNKRFGFVTEDLVFFIDAPNQKIMVIGHTHHTKLRLEAKQMVTSCGS